MINIQAVTKQYGYLCGADSDFVLSHFSDNCVDVLKILHKPFDNQTMFQKKTKVEKVCFKRQTTL